MLIKKLEKMGMEGHKHILLAPILPRQDPLTPDIELKCLTLQIFNLNKPMTYIW